MAIKKTKKKSKILPKAEDGKIVKKATTSKEAMNNISNKLQSTPGYKTAVSSILKKIKS